MKTIWKRFLATLLFVTLSITGTVAANATAQISGTTPYVANVSGSDVWQGNLPSKLVFSDTYSSKVEFPITGILPYATLADRATGVKVEFELWSQSGSKLGYDTVYSSDWNPVGPNTMVSIYASGAQTSGVATLLVRTIWTVRTNGLLSSYLQTEYRQNVDVLTGSVPKAIKNLSGTFKGKNISYKFSKPASSRPITTYIVKIGFIDDNSLSPKYQSNFSQMSPLKNISKNSFTLSKKEVSAKIAELGLVGPKYFMLTVIAVSELGESPVSNGIYTKTTDLK